MSERERERNTPARYTTKIECNLNSCDVVSFGSRLRKRKQNIRSTNEPAHFITFTSSLVVVARKERREKKEKRERKERKKERERERERERK